MSKPEQEAYERIIRYAMELRKRDYRADLNNWKQEYEAVMKRKPKVEDYV